MRTLCCIIQLQFLFLLVTGSTIYKREVTGNEAERYVLCHLEGDTILRPGEDSFSPEDLDADICTHVVYNRAVINPETLRLDPRSPSVDLYDNGGRGLYNRTIKLKERNPQLKVLIDVSNVENALRGHKLNTSATSLLVHNALRFLRHHGFDGMNLRGTIGNDLEDVICSIYEEMANHGFILTTVLLPFSPREQSKIEVFASVAKCYHLLVIGSYWRWDEDKTTVFSSLAELERVVTAYEGLGFPMAKMVVGVPTFAFSYKLCNRSDSGVGGEICGPGDEGSYEPPKMILLGFELAKKMSNASEDWVVERDQESSMPFGHSASYLWTSFEDALSVQTKAKFVKERGLAGVAVMNVDMEDFRGLNEKGETFPLTRAAYRTLRGN